MSIRIFWCHPRLRDYRVSLFRLMSQTYSIRFLFQIPSGADQSFECVYTRNHRIVSTFRPIPLGDVRTLYEGIRWSDVYISSFIWSTYTVSGLVIAKLLGKKVIAWEEIMLMRSNFKSQLKYCFARLLFRYIDAFFVLGEIQKTTLLKLGANSETIFVANEYPDLLYHAITPQPVDLPFDKETIIVLYLGRLIEVKGVKYLIESFGQLEKDHTGMALLIVGDGPLRRDLQSLAGMLGIQSIYFAGEITDVHQKAYLFQRSRVVVVPSITTERQAEGGPLVVLEALSAGRPVIGTNALGSSTALIRDGVNGFVVPEKDSNALYEKIKRLIATPDITEKRVLDSFAEIRGHEYQAEMLQAAIHWAMGNVKNESLQSE